MSPEPSWRAVAAWFARQLLRDLRLVGGYEHLYPKVRNFLREGLFQESPVDLDDPIVLRNLAEADAIKITFDTFTAAINQLTITERGTSEIRDYIRLRNTRPFRTDHRPHILPKKSVFNRIVAEPHAGGFELTSAAFLEAAADVTSFAKNYLAVGFRIDYVKADGSLSNYVPDFLVKDTDGNIFIIETKGREELDLPQKMARLKLWCADATEASKAIGGPAYGFVYVDQESFERHKPKTLAALRAAFTEYQGDE